MIKLYGFGPGLGLPDLSPFVIKAMILLEMAGLPFEVKTGLGGVRKAPKRKLPFIEDDGKVVADSRFILSYLERQYGADFSGGYDETTLAIGLMAERMLEESSYFLALERRWIRPDGWAVLERTAFRRLPRPMRAIFPPLVRRSVRKSLEGQGTGRLTESENDALAAENGRALALLLADKPYLLGDRPCRSDATALAFILAGSCDAFPGAIRDSIVNEPNVLAYRDRLRAQYLQASAKAESPG